MLGGSFSSPEDGSGYVPLSKLHGITIHMTKLFLAITVKTQTQLNNP
jgi:hypothetical protein